MVTIWEKHTVDTNKCRRRENKVWCTLYFHESYLTSWDFTEFCCITDPQPEGGSTYGVLRTVTLISCYHID